MAILFWSSVAISAICALALPVVVVRIPADYFARRRKSEAASPRPGGGWRLLALIVRNALAALFLLAGLFMLFTPGQGVLMLLAGLWLASFPGKRAFELRLIRAPGVAKTINFLRKRAGKPALILPESQGR